MKLFMMTDMEGCSGVVLERQLHGLETPPQRGAAILAGETNAAVASAYDNGVTEILVANGHVSPAELNWDLLDRRPRYILGGADSMGIDESFSAMGFIGQHALVGSGGVLEHSFSMKDYHTVKLNGIVIGEAGFCSAVAGDAGVPVVFFSGDDVACREIEALVDGVATAAVKQALSRNAAISLHPQAAGELIAQAVADGLGRRDRIKPWKLDGPVEMIIEYNACAPAERNSTVPGIERAAPRAVRYVADSATDAYRMFALLSRVV